VSLVTQTLCKVREFEEEVLFVLLYWPNQTWFPELMLLATTPHWHIPLRKDLLSHLMAPMSRPLEPPRVVFGLDAENLSDLPL